MPKMKSAAEHKIWKTLMRATEAGTVPDGYYGPETCRWATQEEVRHFGLNAYPLVHLDDTGNIDCYFTETEAVVISRKH